jgi:hypothetical protein
MTEVKEMRLTERKAVELRDEYIDRIDVLDKVKQLFLIPEINAVTTAQVATFYEVDADTIKKCYQRNKQEIDCDGIMHATSNLLKGHYVPKETDKGGITYEIADGVFIKIPNRGALCFSKRAVLRIGMLLRDSKIAKEVRTQLLNTFENTGDDVKVSDIDEELAIQAKIGEAFMSGDMEAVSVAVAEGMAYKNRHIKMLQNSNEDLTIVNKALTEKTLAWEDRACLNRAIRLMASIRGVGTGQVWNELYKELLYGHSINLRARGTKPYIRHVKPEEWSEVIATFTAMCESRYLDTADILKKAKLDTDIDH